MVFKDILAIVPVELHDDEFTVAQVHQVFKVLDAPMIPFHEKAARHEAMRDQQHNAGEVLLPKLAPEGLVEAAHAIVGIGGGFTERDAVEKVSVGSPLLPDPLHLIPARLKVAKVLLAQSRFFVDPNRVTLERRRERIVGRQRAYYAVCCLSCSSIW